MIFVPVWNREVPDSKDCMANDLYFALPHMEHTVKCLLGSPSKEKYVLNEPITKCRRYCVSNKNETNYILDSIFLPQH